MSDHSRVLVPIETWCYNAPELASRGITVDLGQLAEALIYYEQVLLNVTTQPQLAAVLEWFIRQDRFNEFLALCRDGTLQIYEYSFATAPIYHAEKDTYILM